MLLVTIQGVFYLLVFKLGPALQCLVQRLLGIREFLQYRSGGLVIL